jgi:hypothetical protein
MKMETKNGNLISPVVAKAIEKELDSYPNYPYGKALANPSLRKSILAHVVSQLPSQYTNFEKKQKSSTKSDDLSLPPEDEVYIKNLIRQEIAYIMQQKGECISQSAPEEASSCFAPSHWFG